MDKINEKVGAWLQMPGNTKEKMADELGITRGSLLNKLQGRSPWQWLEVCAIAQLVGCTPNDFLEAE